MTWLKLYSGPGIDHEFCSLTHFGLPNRLITWALMIFPNWTLVPTFPSDSLWVVFFFSFFFNVVFIYFLSSDLGPGLWNVYLEWSWALKIMFLVPVLWYLVLEDTAPHTLPWVTSQAPLAGKLCHLPWATLASGFFFSHIRFRTFSTKLAFLHLLMFSILLF